MVKLPDLRPMMTCNGAVRRPGRAGGGKRPDSSISKPPSIIRECFTESVSSRRTETVLILRLPRTVIKQCRRCEARRDVAKPGQPR